MTERLRRALIAIACVTAGLVSVSADTSRAVADLGGPVLVDGTDSGFHGSWSQAGVQGGWLYQLRWYQILMGLVPAGYANNGKVAVIGAERDVLSTIQNCGAAATRIAAQLGIQADFFDGPTAIKGFFDSVRAGSSPYRLVHIVEETLYIPASPGCDNGMSPEEVAAVNASYDGIAAHVNRGGALFTQNQTYGWLKTLFPSVSTRLCGGTTPQFTAEGAAVFPAAQPVDAQSPYHQCFSPNTGSYPLVLVTKDGAVDVALGSPSVVFPRQAGSQSPDAEDGCGGPCIERFAGDDRYQTAALVADSSSDASTVVLTSGENFPDAIVGGSLASYLNAPILLTRTSGLPASTRDFLRNNETRDVLLMGGPAAIDFDVFGELRNLGLDVRRVWGPDRYGTARAIAAEWSEGSGTVVLASGTSYVDQVVGARIASSRQAPLLLVRADGTIDSETADELKRLEPTEVVLVGGGANVSETAVRDVLPGVTVSSIREDSPTRMSIAAANFAKSSWDTVMLVTEEKFPDGLSGIPLAARNNEALVLMPSECVPQALATVVFIRGIESFTVLGGSAAIFDGVETMEPVCAS